MNICIAYETYSSSTETVVTIVATKLTEKGHAVTVRRMRDGVRPEDLKKTDLTIFATPSWFECGKEGQPHISFLNFMDTAQNESFSGMKFALIGLGDSTYAHFCHAIDLLGGFLERHEAQNIAPTLKLDSFLSNTEHETKRLEEWIDRLPLH